MLVSGSVRKLCHRHISYFVEKAACSDVYHILLVICPCVVSFIAGSHKTGQKFRIKFILVSIRNIAQQKHHLLGTSQQLAELRRILRIGYLFNRFGNQFQLVLVTVTQFSFASELFLDLFFKRFQLRHHGLGGPLVFLECSQATIDYNNRLQPTHYRVTNTSNSDILFGKDYTYTTGSNNDNDGSKAMHKQQ